MLEINSIKYLLKYDFNWWIFIELTSNINLIEIKLNVIKNIISGIYTSKSYIFSKIDIINMYLKRDFNKNFNQNV